MNHSTQPCSRRLPSSAAAALCAVLAATLATALPAQAARASGDAAAATDKAGKATRKKPGQKGVRIINSRNNSGETAAERDRRLYRECKGLPNAGACSGYTQR